MNRKLAIKNDYSVKLEEALEKIKVILKFDDFGPCPFDNETDCHYHTKETILEIIDKVRSHRNEQTRDIKRNRKDKRTSCQYGEATREMGV